MEKGYSITEVARLLGIQVRTARLWAEQGKIRAKKIAGSRRWVVTESEVKRLRQEN